jgi:S-adenosylmethionine synthetase
MVIAYLPHIPVAQQQMELVERKGLGHPDSICDAIMEAISVALCQTYLDAIGHVLHHNLDKGLLVAGQTTPALGGGTVEAPMRLIVGDRATVEWQGQRFPVGAIAEATARQWLREHLRFVDPDRHGLASEGWNPTGKPQKVRHTAACLTPLRALWPSKTWAVATRGAWRLPLPPPANGTMR